MNLLKPAPCPTGCDVDADQADTPGATAMSDFVEWLESGYPGSLTHRLGWQLCGPHRSIDVIAGPDETTHLLILPALPLQQDVGAPVAVAHPGWARPLIRILNAACSSATLR